MHTHAVNKSVSYSYNYNRRDKEKDLRCSILIFISDDKVASHWMCGFLHAEYHDAFNASSTATYSCVSFSRREQQKERDKEA